MSHNSDSESNSSDPLLDGKSEQSDYGSQKHKKVKVDDANHKLPQNDDEQFIKISRKTSDDLIKYFERLPDTEINKLLEYMKTQNSPDLPVKLDMKKFLPKDNFSLNSEDDSDQDKRKKKRESKEKQCRCCKQVVKRHQCQHTLCDKPCIIQDKIKKCKP